VPSTCSATPMSRCWSVCGSCARIFTAYDAVYVALTEVLDGVFLTCDGPLSRAPGLADRVVLVQATRSNR
jgi:predicted nucleic acid-binding protein